MHDIEPFFRWREQYDSSEDERSPFFGRQYSEFYFTNKVYNYYIHPQWDDFGSTTLYLKILFVDYDEACAIIELIGEWNDCLYNDVMYLKRELIDPMLEQGIHKFIFIYENVLNFHGSDDCYYEEWYEEIRDQDGWICFLNTSKHVEQEMKSVRLQYYVNFGEAFASINWRPMEPLVLFEKIESVVHAGNKRLN